MNPEDLLGFEGSAACEALAAAGWQVRLAFTAPPRGGRPAGPPRVIRVRRTAEKEVELLCAAPDWSGGHRLREKRGATT